MVAQGINGHYKYTLYMCLKGRYGDLVSFQKPKNVFALTESKTNGPMCDKLPQNVPRVFPGDTAPLNLSFIGELFLINFNYRMLYLHTIAGDWVTGRTSLALT